ncbi:MAG: patatin-like phospholipase family protein [Actinobacteria bacterium]|nr:patatin-like phospholipase family protein [Actinomycetota bacterium]
MQRPDVLVLGAGGTIGAAWMGGVLAGVAAESGIDFAACERIVGTSAGSMLAADLLAGVEPRAAGEPSAANGAGPLPAEDEAASALLLMSGAAQSETGSDDGERLRERAARVGAGLASLAGSSLAPVALSLGRGPGALVRAAALARMEPAQRSLDDLGARIARHALSWDGRLRVACVERARGRRVVFGAPGAPDATVAQAVQASCSIPWVYRPVRIGDVEYVDGAVWSPANMDAAPAGRETHLLCLAPMGGPLGTRERHPAVRAATTAALRLETLALRRRGVHVTVVVPEPADAGEHACVTGFRQGRALGRAV